MPATPTDAAQRVLDAFSALESAAKGATPQDRLRVETRLRVTTRHNGREPIVIGPWSPGQTVTETIESG
jgi:hypothetical protein